MLHKGILPHHTKWVKLFENLRYVVIDELHSYRGVFGSHVANVLRRLQRLCAFYGSEPQFLCCSATIGNPRELAEALTGRGDDAGRPQRRAARREVLRDLQPAGRQPPARDPPLRAQLARATWRCRFLEKGLQTIVFAPSRLATEVLVTYLKEAIETRPGSEGVIRGYRGGYLPLKRREIERGLREGSVLGVVSTNALELGIDIGSLDVAVLLGYPGSVASTWQQAGRAGRRNGTSVAVLVANSTPLDQYIAQHPDYFFDAPVEQARINPDNLHILVSHVKCAAFELPLRGRRALRRRGPRRDPGLPRGGAAAAPLGRTLALDERELPGRRGQPAQRLLGQLRGAGRHARAADHRRGRLRQRPGDAPREGDLHPRGAHLLRREVRPPGAPRPRARGGGRLLHGRDHPHQGAHPRPLRRAAERRRAQEPRRGPRHLAGGGLQEDASSTPTRTSARASCRCPRTRCTRPRTG